MPATFKNNLYTMPDHPKIHHAQAQRRSFEVFVNILVFVHRVAHLSCTFVDVPQAQQAAPEQWASHIALRLVAFVMQHWNGAGANNAHITFQHTPELR